MEPFVLLLGIPALMLVAVVVMTRLDPPPTIEELDPEEEPDRFGEEL